MSYVCFVVNQNCEPLMPTFNPKKVRKLLKSGKAEIYKRNPFTIRLLYDVEPNNQPVEVGMDTGYQHIGFSIKSEKHEYWHAEYTLLPDEKIKHQDQLMYRRNRRSRLRHRKPKFKNKTDGKRLTNKKEGWLAPSIKNKADRHVDLIKRFREVCPILFATLEVGQFDIATLHAYEAGLPLPKGEDYQRGMRQGFQTLREAVLQRDNYTCQCCGKSMKDGAILCVHHIGFRKRDRSNRATNVITLCTDCHTPANHQKGGVLYDWQPNAKTVKEATYMNIVKYYVCEQVKSTGLETHLTYGTNTKRVRRISRIGKSHANDAYCIGNFLPKHRSTAQYFEKKRRNNRCLTIKYEDAKYVDVRDGKEKAGKVLASDRTRRCEPRNGPNNLRPFRGKKIKSGRRVARTRRYSVGVGEIWQFQGEKFRVIGNAGGYKTVKGIKYPDPTRDKIVWKLPTGGTKSRKITDCELVKRENGGWRTVDCISIKEASKAFGLTSEDIESLYEDPKLRALFVRDGNEKLINKAKFVNYLSKQRR